MIFFSILIVFIPFIDICNSSVKYSIQLHEAETNWRIKNHTLLSIFYTTLLKARQLLAIVQDAVDPGFVTQLSLCHCISTIILISSNFSTIAVTCLNSDPRWTRSMNFSMPITSTCHGLVGPLEAYLRTPFYHNGSRNGWWRGDRRGCRWHPSTTDSIHRGRAPNPNIW